MNILPRLASCGLNFNIVMVYFTSPLERTANNMRLLTKVLSKNNLCAIIQNSH